MPSRLAALLALCLISFAPTAHAQSSTASGSEDGFQVVLPLAGLGVPMLLALPVLLDEGHTPRPGSGMWRGAIGWQSGPDALHVPASAGGYFGAVSWLGLEGRYGSRLSGERLYDMNLEVTELALVRPVPADWPVWVELMAGAGFEAGFGRDQDAFIHGGPSGGLRLGGRVTVSPGTHVILEADVLYHARFSPDWGGVRHLFEAGAMLAIMFDVPKTPNAGGLTLEYRYERATIAEPTLPEAHQVTIGGQVTF